jgi:hypothetical protein
MNADAPDAATWRRLFATLSGDAAGDATVLREFCETHGITAAQVMAELHAHRQRAEE